MASLHASNELPSSAQDSSRLRDRLEMLAAMLAQQAEDGIMQLLAPSVMSPGAAEALPQPNIAHVASSIAAAFRTSTIKLLVPEMRRLLTSPDFQAQVSDAQDLSLGVADLSYTSTPQTSAPNTAPTTPNTTSSVASGVAPNNPNNLGRVPNQEDTAVLHLATSALEDEVNQGSGFSLTISYSPSTPASLPDRISADHRSASVGEGRHAGQLTAPVLKRLSTGGCYEREQHQERLEQQEQEQKQQQLLCHRRALAATFSELNPITVPSNHFHPIDIPNKTDKRSPAEDTPTSQQLSLSQQTLQQTSYDLPSQAFAPRDEISPMQSSDAPAAAFRGLTISSPKPHMEDGWIHSFNMKPHQHVQMNERRDPAGKDGSNVSTPRLTSEASATAAMMAAVQQHMQQQNQQQQNQQQNQQNQQFLKHAQQQQFLQQQMQQMQQQQGEDLLTMLAMQQSLGSGTQDSSGSFAGSSSSSNALSASMNALAMAHAWRSVPSTPASSRQPQDLGYHGGRPQQGSGVGLLSSSLAQLGKGQGQGRDGDTQQDQIQGMAAAQAHAHAQAQARLDALCSPRRLDVGDVYPMSFSMASDASPVSVGTAPMSPFDRAGMPTLSDYMLMSPASGNGGPGRGLLPGLRPPPPPPQMGQERRSNSGHLLRSHTHMLPTVSEPVASVADLFGSSMQMMGSASEPSALALSASDFARHSLHCSSGSPIIKDGGNAMHQQFGGTGMHHQLQQQHFSGSCVNPQQQQHPLLRSSSSVAYASIVDAAGSLSRQLSCPSNEVTEPPSRFKVLPEAVQSRIMALTAANPVISVKDFDEKVVSKMNVLVDLHGAEEALAMLLHLEHRMRTKQGVMKNGPGYLDVAVSSHLDMLKAQGSCPKHMTTEEYAAHTLSPPVLHELREAVQNSKWLHWNHLDQGIIQLIKKLPKDSAVEKLQEIGFHSFKNVDNIKGCIMSILNSKIREDRRKQ